MIVTASFATTAAGGTVLINTDGTFAYQSVAGFSGTDWFDYTLVDEHFATDIARVTIDVLPTTGANNMPVAAPDNFNGIEDTKIIGNLLADNGHGADSDPDGNPLTVQNHTIVTTAGGVVSIQANGDFVYTPRANFSGADSFSYTLRDSLGAKDTATVSLAVASVNDLPIARNDVLSGRHGEPIIGNVLVNNGHGADSDPDGDALTVEAASIVTAKGGLVSLSSDGTFTYTPQTKFVGVDTFTYTLLDGQGGSSEGTVSLNVVNLAPVAYADLYSGVFNKPISGNVLSNDWDPDGDALSVTAQAMTTAKGGTVMLQADGAFTYKPSFGFTGTDSFAYSVDDGFGGSATGIASLSYSPPYGSMQGTAGIDRLTGTEGADTILAYGDDDVVSGGGGNDLLIGGDGKDVLNGGNGNDTLVGGSGRDQLTGGAGNDMLLGGADDDKLSGGAGADQLFGGTGIDELTGGSGADRFVFDGPVGSGIDKVKDFAHGTDTLALDGSLFGLSAGALPGASYFALAAGASDIDHGRFLYDTVALLLSWDADGRAGTANAGIATFNSSASLSVSDIFLF